MTSRLFVIAAFAATATLSFAQTPVVLFSNIATSPTSDVPGLAAKFNLGTGTQFDRPFLSPNGAFWVLVANTNLTAAENEIVLLGDCVSTAGSMVVAREGTPTQFDGSVNYGIFKTQLGINDSGQFAYGVDTTYPTASDDVIVRSNGSLYELIAREGTQAPGQGAGVGYGSVNNAAHILNNGDVRFRSAALTGATTQQVLYSNTDLLTGSIVAQTDVTIPTSQLVAPDQSLDNVTSDRYRSDAVGANAIYHGDLNGPITSDLVMVLNGAILAQEGAVLPGSSFVDNVSSISADAGSQQISPRNGHYMFRGSNAVSNIDWVYKNGAVVAATDAPIIPASLELFDDGIFTTTFFLNVCNSNGNYLIGGVTNAVDLTANAVVTLNGTSVFMREGDPVDVDGNGLADDDAFISVFNNDDCVLTDDDRYYFCADLRNGAGASIGQSFMIKALPKLYGTVDLQDYDGDETAVPITIEVRTPGSTVPLETSIVNVDSSGRFRVITSLPAGSYDVAVKAANWLRRNQPSVAFSAVGACDLTYSLFNGDADEDNEIAIGDFSIISANFNGSGPDGDINGDGSVDIGDYAIMSQNFNLLGDD